MSDEKEEEKRIDRMFEEAIEITDRIREKYEEDLHWDRSPTLWDLQGKKKHDS